MSAPQLDPWTHASAQVAPGAFATERTDVAAPSPGWRALPPPPPGAAAAWREVVWVDAVERIDARGFLAAAPGQAPVPGTLVSFGLGAAVTYPGGTARARCVPLAVCRRAFVGGELPPTVSLTLPPCGSERGRLYYRPVAAGAANGEALREAVARERTELETRLVRYLLRAHSTALVVRDGPVPDGLLGAPRVLGWLKSIHAVPLGPAHLPALRGLRRGERSPLYQAGLPDRGRFEWQVAVRDPSPTWHDLAHLVRLQAATDDPAHAAALAAWTSAWAPRFATQSRHSARAPQQPLPVEVLEQRLKARLGDPHLVRARLKQHLRDHSPP